MIMIRSNTKHAFYWVSVFFCQWSSLYCIYSVDVPFQGKCQAALVNQWQKGTQINAAMLKS